MNAKPSRLMLALLTAASSASGQSSLTVFGVIDVGVRHVDNASTSASAGQGAGQRPAGQISG